MNENIYDITLNLSQTIIPSSTKIIITNNKYKLIHNLSIDQIYSSEEEDLDNLTNLIPNKLDIINSNKYEELKEFLESVEIKEEINENKQICLSLYNNFLPPVEENKSNPIKKYILKKEDNLKPSLIKDYFNNVIEIKKLQTGTWSLAAVPNTKGEYFIFNEVEKILTLVDSNGKVLLSSGKIFKERIRKVILLKNGQIACGGEDKFICLFDQTTLKDLYYIYKNFHIYDILEISENIISVAYETGIIEIINLLNMKILSSINTNSYSIYKMLFISNQIVGIDGYFEQCHQKYHCIKINNEFTSMSLLYQSNKLESIPCNICILDKQHYVISLINTGLYVININDYQIKKFFEYLTCSRMVYVEDNIIVGFSTNKEDTKFRIFKVSSSNYEILHERSTSLVNHKHFIGGNNKKFIVCSGDEFQLEIQIKIN